MHLNTLLSWKLTYPSFTVSINIWTIRSAAPESVQRGPKTILEQDKRAALMKKETRDLDEGRNFSSV